jgi:hypothetical protein
MSLERYVQSLKGRFDRLCIRPPDLQPAALLAGTGQAILDWCHQDSGPGHVGLLQIGAQPRVEQRLMLGALRGPDDAACMALADALGCEIDGSHRLAAMTGRVPGLLWRLQVKGLDAAWWRQRQRSDPWDAGWAVNTPPSMRRWKQGFMPRRATLLLADWREEHDLRMVLAQLVQRSDDFRHPVRWLWVGGPADLASQPGMPIRRFTLG